MQGLVEDAVGILLDALRGAAIAGDLAEQGVERHGSIGQADHAEEDAAADDCRQAVAALLPGVEIGGRRHPAPQNVRSKTAEPSFTMLVA